jgi:hypothetical protein
MSGIIAAPVVEAVEVPAVVTPPAPPKTVATADLPPEALKQRLDQARHAKEVELLASLGIANIDEAKAAIAAHNAAKEAAKSDAEKLAALNLKVSAQADALNVAVAQVVAKITPEQKAAVDVLAGTDSAAWLKTYAALASTWVVPVTPAADLPTATPPLKTSTAPNAPAPSPSGGTSPTNHAATYKALEASNPFAAAAYSVKYGDACYK